MPRLARKCTGCHSKLLDVKEFNLQNSLCNKCVEKNKKYYYMKQNNIHMITKQMMMNARRRAKKHNISMNINLEYIRNIFPKNNKCPYLDIEFVRGKLNSCSNSPSLDRIDPTKGYVVGNVEIISMKANSIKQNATPEEIEMVAKRLKRLQQDGR
ncbi:MAG TPA: hypothetical protein VMX17_09990 [Candidatus Glassbacteria bacterium]|nr:hypothetical protein [Candidatus Glassbacteria bacterium]